MADLPDVFNRLRRLLARHEPGLEWRDAYIGSQAKVKKPAYHLYGKDLVSILGRKPERIYFAGTVLNKNFVSLYFMPMYCHPDKFQEMDPSLKKLVKGKSCFNIKELDPEIIDQFDQTLSLGRQLYQQSGWI